MLNGMESFNLGIVYSKLYMYMHESVQEWWIDHIHEPIDWVTYP